MSYRDSRDILGKRITAVVIKHGKSPNWQLFLVLDDSSHYEFSGMGFLDQGKGCWPGSGLERVREYMCTGQKIVFEAVLDEVASRGPAPLPHAAPAARTTPATGIATPPATAPRRCPTSCRSTRAPRARARRRQALRPPRR